jgi:hypothetical protein
MRLPPLLVCLFGMLCAATTPLASASDSLWLELPGRAGPGQGLRVVLVAGDEEYRSEETMPMLGKLLSQRHGFTCTVLFPIDPATGLINPNVQTNIPGLDALAQADLLIIGTRFRRLPPEQLRPIADYLQAGKPVIGLRTATHAFTGDAETDGIVWRDFGLNVLGEKWVAHHGEHKVEGARGVIEPAQAQHPILNGVKDVFGPSDVYTVVNLPDDATILLRGQVTTTLAPDSPAVTGSKNQPMMPLAWLRNYQVPQGRNGQAFCTTMGAAVDFLSEDLRRLIVNAAFHLTQRPVPARADVRFVDPFEPTFYGFVNDHEPWLARQLRPADFGLGRATVPFKVVTVPPSWAEAMGGAARP